MLDYVTAREKTSVSGCVYRMIDENLTLLTNKIIRRIRSMQVGYLNRSKFKFLF